MTASTRPDIAAMQRQINAMQVDLDRLTRALLGEKDDPTPSFMDRAMSVIVTFERSNWVLKGGVRIILLIGALAAAVSAAVATVKPYLGWPQ